MSVASERDGGAPPAEDGRHGAPAGIARVGGLLAAILLVGAVFGLLNPAFLTLDIATSVLRSMRSVALLGLGLTLDIVAGEIDLSVGAMYGLASNALAVIWILGGVPICLALPLALGIGAAVGLLNRLLSTVCRIPSLIVTLGSHNLIYGLSLLITSATTFNPAYPPDGCAVVPEQVSFFTGLTRQVGAHQVSAEILWLALAAAAVADLLHGSLFGLRLFAIGGHATAARFARLPVVRHRIVAFADGPRDPCPPRWRQAQMAVSTRTITRRRLYQDVVAHLETQIHDGTYRPGDELPSERSLMGTSASAAPRSARPCSRCRRWASSRCGRASGRASSSRPTPRCSKPCAARSGA